ncbi:DUF2194 domain-containing protein [Flavobacterium psychrotolerans]|uniref:DUF2194 domain-containing protein n=1 Tax=Flavobacterium psychrotolerans TaxID=2169410 RepID=A0A2U1JM42_9FLAO|nr:DUF2194 domain-containing protein [Flavobacterium psychrotolerans]PWA05943.1 hypothetical protein DB895_05855 [Flavobacterium psychrotolerans]
MKSLQLIKKKQLYLIITILFLAINTNCEGLEDWSDLKSAYLLDETNKLEADNDFKRYSEPGMSSQPLIEYIVDEKEPMSVNYDAHIRKICDYTKLPFRTIDINTWNATLIISPSTRVLSIYDTSKLNDASITKILDFISNGGTLFIPDAYEDHRMAFLYGFIPEAEFATDKNAKGFYFITPMLPNLKGKTFLSSFVHFSFDSQNFSNRIKILASTINNHNFPLIIENKIGKGRVLFFNTTTDFRKEDRGLFFAGMLKGLEGIPYPVANTATIFLDDFPSPVYNVKAEPIASEMNLSMSDFVAKVWWPDMKKIANEHKIPYSVMTTFDYKNKIIPPFTLDQWNAIKITSNNKVQPETDWLVKDAKKNGHEIAFHGYNHVSLKTNLWKNQDFIGTALSTVKKKWDISDFGNLPTTYVPPSNVIDKNGLKELKKAMPSLKYMCSLYLDQGEDGGNREFDYDPYNKEFFDYPRITSGFYLADDSKFNQQSMYLFTGVWTHFVHPDDVFELPKPGLDDWHMANLRNSLGYGWYKTKGKDKAMITEFKKYLREIKSVFPQMRFVNANDGAKMVIDWRTSRYTHKSENGIYTVKEINPDAKNKQYWFLFGSNSNTEKIETQLKKQAVLFSKTPMIDGYLYSICTKEPKLAMIDFNYKNENQKALQVQENQTVMADYTKYTIAAKRFQSGAIWLDDSDEKLKLEMASLKGKMLNDAVIDSVIWNKYSKYLSWNKRGGEAWKMFEEHTLKYPFKENIMYSNELDRVIGYPDDFVKEKWMSAQMGATPNDTDLLNNYITNFNTDENQERIKNILKKLYSLDNSAINYKNYLKHLMQYQPEEALNKLCDIKPCEDLSELATQTVWLFADANEYQKAYDWSEFSKEIDFVTQMNWLFELKKYNLIEVEFLKHIVSQPNDYKAKAFMSTIYHEMGRFKDSWIMANSLPDISEKEELKKILNTDVVFETEELKLDLIAHQPELFYPNVLKLIIKENRLLKGDFADAVSSLETNQKNNAIQKNVISYNHFDKKSNLHSFSGTYNNYYKQKLKENYEDNFDNSLLGVQYKFTRAQIEGKPNYWSRARIEVDKSTNPYYQFGIGYNTTGYKKYRSAEFNVFPVETAPGLNQKMYELRLNLYQDIYLFKIINTSISFEGNYYTDGLLSRDTINTNILNPNKFARKIYTTIDSNHYEIATYDEALEGTASVRMALDNEDVKKSKFIPFIESQYSQGTRNQSTGYPFWMIKKRFFGGLGLGWEVVITNFHSKVEAGYFLDDYSKNFKRFTGNVSYQLFDFTALTANVEFFSQSKYYSNSFQFGVKHNFKKKIKR